MSAQGLRSAEAAQLLRKYGPNALPEGKVDSLLVLFLRQFQSPLIFILVAAALIIVFMGDLTDGGIIFSVLLFNAIVGTVQEGRAQNTLRALKSFVETTAAVLRDGIEVIIPDTEVVPGDVVMLREGEKVPADGKVISSQTLTVDEAAMTGESVPVHKDTELQNKVFKGTNVVSGNGVMLVTATGRSTMLGGVAEKIVGVDTEIPLKANIRALSHSIIIAAGVIGAALFGLGIALGNSVQTMFVTVVSLLVSIIPEGLPIVVTLILATGVWRMSKRNALVKKLQAVEALGQAQIIAVDKTGTITRNELVVQRVYTSGVLFDITGQGYVPSGTAMVEGKAITSAQRVMLASMAEIAALCATARVMFDEAHKQWKVAGDPTEAALLVFAEKMGVKKEEEERRSNVRARLVFDYSKKYQALLYGPEKSVVRMLVVGAPEIVLGKCTKVAHGGVSKRISSEEKESLNDLFEKMSQDGLRVVACAVREDKVDRDHIAHDDVHSLTFVGFFGIRDALRAEVPNAMHKAAAAGIRVVMITGDHRATAIAIARDAGIFQMGDGVLTGDEVTAMSDKELSKKVGNVSVFARVSPEHKLRIITAFRSRGEIIAMTGDGVNDAPSLVAADLGVAMGRIGTEVAKEAADIILLDDNFGSIVSAVEEGRSIYKTIKKVILYLFSTSVGEVLTISGALIMSLPLPISAAQIIWLNLVTDGFLDMSLAMEPKESGLLREGQSAARKNLVDWKMFRRMIVMAVPMAIGTLLLFEQYLRIDPTKAGTVALSVLAAFQWFNAWNCRSDEKSLLQMSPFSNLWLIAATFITVTLQMFAVYHPFLQQVLKTVPLDYSDWSKILVVASSIVLIEELRKLFVRLWKKK